MNICILITRMCPDAKLMVTEQKMIESLALHGVQAMDLVPALMTTHTVANPEYDPEEARRHAAEKDASKDDSDDDQTIVEPASPDPRTPTLTSTSFKSSPGHPSPPEPFQTTAKVLKDTSTSAIPGVSTSLSSADEKVTLDIRWTVLCDLFLILIADSVYDARSRVLLENVALKLGLGWLDVVKFESRVTEALEIQEDVEKMEQQDVIEGRQKAARKKRYVMLGLATLGTSPLRHHALISRLILVLIFYDRWRTGNWTLSRLVGTRDWRWAWRRLQYDWHHRDYWVPRWGRGRCGHHDGWGVDWI